MAVSKQFLSLFEFQLAQFADRPDIRSLAVYAAEASKGDGPTLVPVAQWPQSNLVLPSMAHDNPLEAPSELRRWLPLRHEGVLLGALQVDTHELPWPESLRQRLQALALCLTEGLCLDLEQQRLQHELNQQQQQLGVLLHQLRNPLAALRTFGQLLLRRLEGDERNRPLVEGLLQEERQLRRYVEAISRLEDSAAAVIGSSTPEPLLLPPGLSDAEDQPLERLLNPLLQRAAATAALQSRPWHGPSSFPSWHGDSNAVGEILANLLENAFRYSPPGTGVGLHCQPLATGGWELVVWDEGPPIPDEERQRIFRKGERGHSGADQPGSGIGLALAKDLALSMGGSLQLVSPPAAIAEELPAQGNAFSLTLPQQEPQPAQPAP